MGRYLTLFRRGITRDEFNARVARVIEASATLGLEPCYRHADVIVLSSPDLPVIHFANGLVLGEVHSLEGEAWGAHRAIEARMRADSFEAHTLLARFWGSFVALLRHDEEPVLDVLRSPFGRLPCLWSEDAGVLAIASDTIFFKEVFHRRAVVNVSALARRIAYPGLPSPETCVEGITSIPGGTSVIMGIGEGAGQPRAVDVWSPWDSARPADWFESTEEAQFSVRAAIHQATIASRRDADNVLLMLSGGIDSSILAATLSSIGRGFRCVNLVRSDSSGDERQFARLVASHLGVQLTEIEWSLTDVDVTRSDSGALPTPGNRVFMQGTNAAVERAVEQSGADLVIDGGGGDNVFFGLSSVAPVADALRHGNDLGATLVAARSIAEQSQESLATVLRLAVQRIFRRSPAYRWHPALDYLADGARSAISPMPPHNWLKVPPGGSTGAAAHIALVAAAQGWAEECDLVGSVAHACPLATQPVTAACLKVPSWWWHRGPRSRIIAREAFADRLPHHVIWRRSKGSPDSYVAQIYDEHRKVVRAMLLEGRLAQLGLLDTDAIALATASTGSAHAPDFDRLLQLSQVEAWLCAQS